MWRSCLVLGRLRLLPLVGSKLFTVRDHHLAVHRARMRPLGQRLRLGVLEKWGGGVQMPLSCLLRRPFLRRPFLRRPMMWCQRMRSFLPQEYAALYSLLRCLITSRRPLALPVRPTVVHNRLRWPTSGRCFVRFALPCWWLLIFNRRCPGVLAVRWWTRAANNRPCSLRISLILWALLLVLQPVQPFRLMARQCLCGKQDRCTCLSMAAR